MSEKFHFKPVPDWLKKNKISDSTIKDGKGFYPVALSEMEQTPLVWIINYNIPPNELQDLRNEIEKSIDLEELKVMSNNLINFLSDFSEITTELNKKFSGEKSFSEYQKYLNKKLEEKIERKKNLAVSNPKEQELFKLVYKEELNDKANYRKLKTKENFLKYNENGLYVDNCLIEIDKFTDCQLSPLFNRYNQYRQKENKKNGIRKNNRRLLIE